MDRVVDLSKPIESGHPLLTAEDVQRLIAQSRDAEVQRPVNIQINLGEDYGIGDRRRFERRFSLGRSKLVWVIVALLFSASVSYARTRYVCQSFKDDGRFYYGMGVDRCIGILIKQPFDLVGNHLDTLNRSY